MAIEQAVSALSYDGYQNFYGLPARKKDGHLSGILLPLPNMAAKAHCLFWLCGKQ